MDESSEKRHVTMATATNWLLGITILISLVLGVLFTDAFMFRLSHWSDGFYSHPPVHDSWHATGERVTTLILAIAGALANLVLIGTAGSVSSSPAGPKKSIGVAGIVFGVIGFVFCIAMLGYAPSMT